MIEWLKKESKSPNWLGLLALIVTIGFFTYLYFGFVPIFEDTKIDASYLCRSPYSTEPCLSDVYYPDIDVACFISSEKDIFEEVICIKDFRAKRTENYKTWSYSEK